MMCMTKLLHSNLASTTNYNQTFGRGPLCSGLGGDALANPSLEVYLYIISQYNDLSKILIDADNTAMKNDRPCSITTEIMKCRKDENVCVTEVWLNGEPGLLISPK